MAQTQKLKTQISHNLTLLSAPNISTPTELLQQTRTLLHSLLQEIRQLPTQQQNAQIGQYKVLEVRGNFIPSSKSRKGRRDKERVIRQGAVVSVSSIVASPMKPPTRPIDMSASSQPYTNDTPRALGAPLLPQNNSVQQVLNLGHSAQDRIDQALTSISSTAQSGIEQANQINLILNAQITQLSQMQNKLKDTSSSLKRAQKTIRYFVKAAQCDWFVAGMVGLILVAAVAFVVILVKKGK